MFAYAILNKSKNIIKIVTDTQGEKIYITLIVSDYFIVSSTIKSIISFFKKTQKLELN